MSIKRTLLELTSSSSEIHLKKSLSQKYLPSEDYYIRDRYSGIITKTNLEEWAEWFEDYNNRVVLRTLIRDELIISTIFLGAQPYGITPGGKPVLWETALIYINNNRANSEHSIEIIGRYDSELKALEEHYSESDRLRRE